MSAAKIDQHTGQYLDSDGRVRVGCGHYELNLFAVPEDAMGSGLSLVLTGRPKHGSWNVLIWRTDCGLYDFTLTTEESARRLPWLRSATLVTNRESE